MTTLEGFNPFDAETLQCPFPHYARIRDEAPVLRLAELGLYLVTRHDLVLSILRDPATFSSRFGRPTMPMSGDDARRLNAAIAEGYPRVPTMLTADPPDHTRFRGLVAKAFNPRTIAAMEPLVRGLVTTLIEGWGTRTEIEFVSEFAVPLPVSVIATMLSQPVERFGDIKRWSDTSIAGIGTDLSVEARIAAERETNEFQRHFEVEIESRREHPVGDLLSNLVHATIDEPGVDTRPLEMDEMLSIISQLMVAGNETTTKLLAEMMRLLGEHPEVWGRIADEPTLVERVVEESLRLSSPTQGIFRIATNDIVLEGVRIPKAPGWCWSTGRQPRRERVCRRRRLRPGPGSSEGTPAFGKGIHFCLGAAFSRLEARVALEELRRRIDSFQLAPRQRLPLHPELHAPRLMRLYLASRSAGRP